MEQEPKQKPEIDPERKRRIFEALDRRADELADEAFRTARTFKAAVCSLAAKASAHPDKAERLAAGAALVRVALKYEEELVEEIRKLAGRNARGWRTKAGAKARPA